jgi:hypothetical protein
VLADDQPRHGFKQFTWTIYGAGFQLLLRHNAFVSCTRLTQHAVTGTLHYDRSEARVSGLRLGYNLRKQTRCQYGQLVLAERPLRGIECTGHGGRIHEVL